MKKETRTYLLILSAALAAATSLKADGTLPPERQKLIPLPAGAITARGWALETLRRSRDGMGGHYGEFDPDQFEKPGQTDDYDAKLPGAKGKDMPGWCAEMSGQYRLGQLMLSLTLGDAELGAKFAAWRDALLARQGPDGYLGSYRPGDNKYEDYNAWGAHFYYRALLLDYSRTRDPRVLDALHRGLLWFVREWAGERKGHYAGPTLIWPLVEVYRLTGDRRLIDFCEEWRRFLDNRADAWHPRRPNHLNKGGFSQLSLVPRSFHTVAYAVRAQLPGVLSLANGDESLLADSVAALDNLLVRVGWEATWAPASERERIYPPSCIGETEYCNFVNWMEYLQWLSRLTGETRFGDLVERMVFNAAMGGRKKDERAISYSTSPNQFRATKTSTRGGLQRFYEAYCPCEYAACCSAQSIRLIPSYLLKCVMKTPDGDLAVNTYAPCRADADEATVEVKTDYPFEDPVRVEVTAKNGWNGRLRLRRPSWAFGAAVTRNGKAVSANEENGWIVLAGPWRGDEVKVVFDQRPVVRASPERRGIFGEEDEWGRGEPCHEIYTGEPLRTVEWGPLVFAQPLPEKWTAVPDDPTSRPLPPGWTWFEATCAEKPAIYAMPPETAFDANSIKVKRVETTGYPWETPPVRLVVPLVRATRAYVPDPELQTQNPRPLMNPAPADPGAKVEEVELVPVGATNLRITSFPLGVLKK